MKFTRKLSVIETSAGNRNIGLIGNRFADPQQAIAFAEGASRAAIIKES